jgi:hypothetical protein
MSPALDEKDALALPGEGTAVGPAEFARRLLDRGEVARVRSPLRRVKVKDAPRMRFLRETGIKACLRWLVRSGGWRTRHVVAGKRRREGRVWGQGIYEALDVRYSAACLELLAHVTTNAQTARPTFPPPSALGGVAPTTTGDLVFFHLVLDALVDSVPVPVPEAPPPAPPEPPTPPQPGGRAKKKASDKTDKPTPQAPPDPAPMRAAFFARQREVIGLSPLTALFRAEEAFGEDSLEAARRTFAPLVAGDRALLLSYLDDALAARWLARETVRRSLPAHEAGPRYVAFAAALEGLARAAREAARPDALRPLLRFFERYLVRFGQREAVCQAFKAQSLTLVRASDRARFLAQVARLFAVGRGLTTENERVLGLPFVERTEEEKVFVADVSELARTVLPELEAIRRELSAEVG